MFSQDDSLPKRLRVRVGGPNESSSNGSQSADQEAAAAASGKLAQIDAIFAKQYQCVRLFLMHFSEFIQSASSFSLCPFHSNFFFPKITSFLLCFEVALRSTCVHSSWQARLAGVFVRISVRYSRMGEL